MNKRDKMRNEAERSDDNEVRKVADRDPRYQRLYDGEWTNIVNHDRAYHGWSKDDAVAHAVKLTETAMAEKFAAYLEATRLESAAATTQPAQPALSAEEREALERVFRMAANFAHEKPDNAIPKDIATVCAALRRVSRNDSRESASDSLGGV